MKMKLKKFSALAAAVFMAACLMGCGSSGSIDYGGGDGDFQNESESETTASESIESAAAETESRTESYAASAVDLTAAIQGKKVGISLPTKDQARWLKDGAALVSKFKARGADVKIDFADNDASSQAGQIQAMIADGYDLLVVAPVEAGSLTETMDKAKSAGIPVISYDRLILDTDAVSAYVSFDNYKTGKMQGDYVKEQLKLSEASAESPLQVEILAGDADDHNAEYGFMGAYDDLREYVDAGTVTILSGNNTFETCAVTGWSEEAAEARMKEILAAAYPEGTKLDAVICANDSIALGAIRALASDYKGENTVIVTGMDCDDANLRQLVDGGQAMDIYKSFGNEASAAVAVGGALLGGAPLDEGLTRSENWSFDCVYDTESYNNGAKDMVSYLLSPVLITKDNIKKELVDTGYYTMEGDYPVSLS